MLGNPFGIKDSILKDKSKLTVKANIVGKDIHTADLYLIKRGIFGWGHRLVFQSDLTEPTREIEAKIEKNKSDLKKLEIKLEQTQLETMDFIRTVEPNVFDDKNIFSRIVSNAKKAKEEKDKPPTRSLVVNMAQNKDKQNNQNQNKGNNSNNQGKR